MAVCLSVVSGAAGSTTWARAHPSLQNGVRSFAGHYEFVFFFFATHYEFFSATVPEHVFSLRDTTNLFCTEVLVRHLSAISWPSARAVSEQ